MASSPARNPPAGRHWAVLQHAAVEGPGLIAAEMRRRGLASAIYRLDQGDGLPEVAALSGLVVLGGPMGVYEADQHPFIRPELDLLRATVAAGLPVLGICLGAQMIAAALGAAVTRGPIAEIGVGEVELTAAGATDPMLGAAGARTSLPVVHWHQDTFALPAGAVLLASSPLYPHQAFRVGRLAYGLQFHLEVDAGVARAWAPELPSGISLPPAHVEKVAAAGGRAFARFFDEAGAISERSGRAGSA